MDSKTPVAVIAALIAGACGPGPVPGDAVGRVYHYERSDIDGGEEEQVHVFRESSTRLAVYKSRKRCWNAAYVTAELDVEAGYAVRLTGGRLLPGATHETFATADFDPASRQFVVSIGQGADAVRAETMIGRLPWHLFDFDLASLNAVAPRLQDPEAGFGFGLARTWADPSREDFVEYLGEIDAQYAGEERRLDTPARRFRLTGSALEGDTGALWLHREEGHILEARLPIPNHLEYEDFRLVLKGVSDGGEQAWSALLRRHFEGCPEAGGERG